MSWKEYHKKNFKKIQKRQRQHYKENRARRLQGIKDRIAEIRLEVFSHYCEGKPYCQCPGCSRNQICFLQLDHKKRTGRKSDKLTGERLWYWVKTHKYPKEFQVLCACCNFSKRNKKQCQMHGKKH